jgi:hypothetical protein
MPGISVTFYPPTDVGLIYSDLFGSRALLAVLSPLPRCPAAPPC